MTTITLNEVCGTDTRTRTSKAAKAASMLFAAGSMLIGTLNAQQADTKVTVTPSTNWNGYMKASVPTNVLPSGIALTTNYSNGGIGDLDAGFIGNVLAFTPNTSISRDISTNNTIWWNADGTGAAQMDASLYVFDTNLAGKIVTFSGYCLNNTLQSPYNTNISAFIKVFDKNTNWGLVSFTNKQITPGPFSLTWKTDSTNRVQYGFEMVGPNASLSKAASLGWVVFSANPNDAEPIFQSPANIRSTSLNGATNIYVTIGSATNVWVQPGGSGVTVQWQKDGANLTGSGATIPQYYWSNVTSSDEGTYTLVLTDSLKRTNSFSVYLKVLDPNDLIIDPNPDAWQSRVSRFTNGGANFVINEEYPATDLKAIFTNGVLSLAPNTKEYANSITNSAYGTNSDGSSKEFLSADYYLEYECLAGKAVTFSGYCPSNTLATNYHNTNYTAVAWIKEVTHGNYKEVTKSTVTLTQGQNFTNRLNMTSSTNLIQYGFSILGPVADPADVSILGQALISVVSPWKMTNVTVNPSTNWLGWMAARALTNGVYTNLFNPGSSGGTNWDLAALDAGFIGNVLAFTPSTAISKQSPISAADPSWWNADGSGARQMDASMYIVDDTLVGKTVTFSGYCLTNTLSADYKTNVSVFIREFNSNWDPISGTNAQVTSSNGLFSITLKTTSTPPSNHVEYGIEMVGPNASVNNATNLGWVLFSPNPSAVVPSMQAPTKIASTSWGNDTNKAAEIGFGASLSASVPNSGFNYQWQKDGVNLAGATSLVLTWSNVLASDAGNYTLVVADQMSRTVDTRSVYLRVLDPSNLILDPNATWVSRVSRFTNNGTSYWTNMSYSASDLKAVFTNGLLSLAPNTREYTNSFPGTNADGSSKESLWADYYIEYDCLTNKSLTFSGYCPSNTVPTNDYKVLAWIKEVNTKDYSTVNSNEMTQILVTGQQFILTLSPTSPTNHVQYGFRTMGPVAKPADASILGQAWVARSDTTNVTVDPSLTWVGWMIARELPTNYYTDGAYVFHTNSGGTFWDAADLDADFMGNLRNVLVFTPSSAISKQSPIRATDPSWWKADGTGARQMDAMYYVNDNNLAGKMVTFTGYCLANTLQPPYSTNINAFIKEFNTNWTMVGITNTLMTNNGAAFSISLQTSISNYVQYGFEMVGPNASTTNIANLGRVVISSNANDVVPPIAAPTIVSQSWGSKANTYATVGATNQIHLKVEANGSGLTYQWRKNSTPLADSAIVSGVKTKDLKWMRSLQASDEGYYTLDITDSGLNTVTCSVRLVVFDPSHLIIDPNATWLSRLLRSTNSGATWTTNDAYPAADLQAAFANNALSLAPNTREYANSYPGTNSDGSSKEYLSADYYIEYGGLAGTALTFAGYCPWTSSLNTNYTVLAWIKELTSGHNEIAKRSKTLKAGQAFIVTLPSSSPTNLIQYGFSTLGPVANPATASSLGQAIVYSMSVPSLAVTTNSNGSLTLTFPTESNLTYTVQCNTNTDLRLTNGSEWKTAKEPNPVTVGDGTPGYLWGVNPIGAPRYYRLSIAPRTP